MQEMTDAQAFGAPSQAPSPSLQDGEMSDEQAFGAPNQESAGKAFARRAGGSLFPSAAGLAAAIPAAGAAAVAAAPADPFTFGGASVVAGLVAGGVAAYGAGSVAGAVQNKVLEAAPETAVSLGQSPGQVAQDEQQHPIASFAGGMAPNLLAFTPGGITKEGLAVMGTIGGAQEAAREGISGEELSPTKIAISAGTMGLMQKPTGITRALESKLGAASWVQKNYAGHENSGDIVSPLSDIADISGGDAAANLAAGNPPSRPVTNDSTQQVQNAFHDGAEGTEPREATQDAAALDVAIAAVPGSEEIIPRAQSSKVIGGDEENYFGQEPPTETQKQAIDNGAPEREQPLDIHEAARQENPEAFDNYSRLLLEKQTLREQLYTMASSQAGTKEVGELHTEMTPDIMQAQQRLAEVNKTISELSPQISEAYRTAQEKMPKIGYSDNVNFGENPVPNKIAEDWEAKLTNAGVDPTTAKAHGELQKAYYEQMSKDTGRSASDLYNEGVSSVKAATPRTKKQNEFSQSPDSKETVSQKLGNKVKSFFNKNSLELNQSAYHGSPHNFDKFTLDHIGSGEGAQAYGWGLYFAGDKKIAEHYRDKLSLADKRIVVDGKTFLRPDGEQFMVDSDWRGELHNFLGLAVDNNLKTSLETVRAAREYNASLGTIKRLTQGFNERFLKYMEGKPSLQVGERPGRLYKVDLPEDHQLLQWDKPISDQPTEVKEALDKVKSQLEKSDVLDDYLDRKNADWDELTGKELYQLLKRAHLDDALPSHPLEEARYMKNDEGASRYLNSIGIEGIKYLDGNSRSAGEGNHNFVVFDDKAINVLHTLYQNSAGVKGTYDIATRVIKLFTGRYDVSTIVHETMHAWLEQRFHYLDDPNVSQSFKNDMNNLRDWAGFNDGEGAGSRSYTAAHEKVARAFERYMSEGRAPTSALARVFGQFKQMMGSLYNAMKRSNYHINEDVRDVFDRFFTSNPQKIVVAPEAETASHMASVHAQDARETTPEHADKVRDNVESEILKLAENDPEAKNAITNADQTGEVPSDASSSPATTSDSPAQEPGQVGTGSGAIGPESGAERTEPAAGGAGERAAATESANDTDARAGNPYAETKPNGTEYLDKAGNIRLDNLNSSEDVKNVLRDLAKQNNGFTADRGGKIPNSVRRAMADALGLDPENFNDQKPANVSNSVWAEAVQKLSIQAVEAVDSAAQKFARTGSLEDDIAYTAAKSRANMIVKQFSNITAEAGRTLKVFDKGNMKFLKDSGDILEQLEQNNNGLTLKQRQAQATILSEMKTPQQKAKFLRAEEKPDFVEKILEYRNNCLLSGPITHLHYIDGNIINTLYKPLKVALASLGGHVELGEAGAMYNALTYGSVKGLKAAAAAWKDPMSSELAPILHSTRQQAIGGRVGDIVNLPMDAINSIHVFFKSLRYEQEIARSSYSKASDEGLQPGTKSHSDRISDLTQSPTDEMMASAFKISKTENYMENFDRDSTLGKLNALANTTVGRFLFPFNKISMNVIRIATRDNTVLGVFSPEVRSILAGDHGKSARDVQVASMAMGTVVMGIAYTMQDSINGGGPADPNANKIWRLTHQPNSVQIGNISMPLKAFGTVGEIMRMAAEYRAAVNDASHEEADKMAGHIVDHVSRVFLNGGLVDGISKLIESIHYGNIAPEMQNFVTGFVPFSTLGSQAARYEDNDARVVHSQGLSNFYGITDAIKKKIPFMSEDLQPMIDSFGNNIDSDKYLAAGGYDKYNSDPVVQRLQSLNIGVSKVPRAIRGISLSAQQYTDFSVASGRYTYSNLKDLFIDQDFAKQSPKEQRKQITKAVGQARKDARDDMMQKYPKIMDAADRAQEEE